MPDPPKSGVSLLRVKFKQAHLWANIKSSLFGVFLGPKLSTASLLGIKRFPDIIRWKIDKITNPYLENVTQRDTERIKCVCELTQ